MTEEPPVVAVQQGKLKGCVKKNLKGETFCSFQGIPYAKPPLGELRFKAPQPPEKWADVRHATEECDECCSKAFKQFFGSEDCLHLNVFTKQIRDRSLKPVMVYVHGGGYVTGSSKAAIYGPEYLMMEDVVLVTLNYRLGLLGFLTLEDSSLGVPGNAGLKDIVMALKWVQNNIEHFSGDPNNVTIFGESAGGSAVHYMMLSPMAKGLFHKAIAQSGCATNGWAVSKRYGAHLLAEQLGIHTNDEKVVLKYLQELPVEEIYKANEKIWDPFYIGRLRPFAPTIEKTTNEPPFISEHPDKIIKSGRYNKVPMIVGSCSREGMFVHAMCASNPKRAHVLNEETLVPASLQLRRGSTQYEDVLRRIKEFYFRNGDPASDIDSILRVYTDNFFLYEIFRCTRLHLETISQPIYFYIFSMETELNFMKNGYGYTEKGACHADEFSYLFKNSGTPEVTDPDSPEMKGVLRMVKMWTNFAKRANPTPEKDYHTLQNVEWRPISKEKFYVLDIGDDLKLLDDHPERKAMEFWDMLHRRYGLSSKL